MPRSLKSQSRLGCSQRRSTDGSVLSPSIVESALKTGIPGPIHLFTVRDRLS